MGPLQTPENGISPVAALQDSSCFNKREEISIKSFLQFFSDYPEYIVRFCARELKSQGAPINGKTLLQECSDRFDPDELPGPNELPNPRHSESGDSHQALLATSAVSTSASAENLSDIKNMDGERFYSLPADFHRESLLTGTVSSSKATLTNGQPQFQISAGLPAINMSTSAADSDMEDDSDYDEVDGFCGNMPQFSISAGLPAMSFLAEGDAVSSSSAHRDVEVDCDEVDGLCENMAEASVSAGLPALNIPLLMESGGDPSSFASNAGGVDCVDGLCVEAADSRTITAGLPAMNILTEGAVVSTATPAPYQDMTLDRDQSKEGGVMTESRVVSAGLPAITIPTSGPNNASYGARGLYHYQHVDDNGFEEEDCVDGLGGNYYSPEMDITSGLLAMDIGADGDSTNYTPASDRYSASLYEDEDCVDGLFGGHLPNQPQRGDSFAVGAANRNSFASNCQATKDVSQRDEASKDRLTAMTRQHEIMENRRLCTQCRINPRDTTFLPCGHFITCSDCAEPLYVCPVCHLSIIGTIKTILSPLLPKH